MKTAALIFLVLLFTGCKEIPALEQCTVDLMRAKVKIEALQVRIKQLELKICEIDKP
jgi:hypothetical protein